MAKEGPIPVHLGIIMDGNGRWAGAKNLPRTMGHREGLETAKKIIKAAREAGIRYVSLYVFSTENWKRAEKEVSFLMGLIRRHLRNEMDFYRENGVKMVHSGDLKGLPLRIRHEIKSVVQDTRNNTGITVNMAINYGGRDAIVRAVNRWAAAGNCGEKLTEDVLRQYLDCPDLPDPDLIIRTSGELRLSNFLVWESAYSEFFSSPKYWPDFEKEDLAEALRHYAGCDRRYGGVKS